MIGRSRRGFSSRIADTRGTTLVEAAIVTPLLLLVTFAIVDFGALLYVPMALQNGVSNASRFGVTGTTMPDLSREDSLRQAVRDATPTLTLSDDKITFTHLPPESTVWVGGTGGPGAIEKITVKYTWELLTPVLQPFFGGDKIDFTVDSTMKNERKFE